MYIYIYILYVYIHTYLYVCVHVYVYMCVCAVFKICRLLQHSQHHAVIRWQMNLYMFIHIYIYIYIYMYTCVCVHIHIYMCGCAVFRICRSLQHSPQRAVSWRQMPWWGFRPQTKHLPQSHHVCFFILCSYCVTMEVTSSDEELIHD